MIFGSSQLPSILQRLKYSRPNISLKPRGQGKNLFKMESPFAFILVVIGAIFIISNGLWIGINHYPVIAATSPASSINTIYNMTSVNVTSINVSSLRPGGFWARISLGIPDYAENSWLAIWLIVAAINLMCGLSLIIDPRGHGNLSPVIILCSFMSLPIGGGFVIGFALSLIGGLAGMEWPRPIQDTFAGRFTRALRLDHSLYRKIREEPHYLSQAVWLLILVNVISGVSYGIYNLTFLAGTTSINQLLSVLFMGKITTDLSIFAYPLIYAGLAVGKWVILSMLIYVVGTKLLDSKCEFAGLAANVAFAYAPIALQAILPMMFSNQPQQLALYLFLITNVWMILGLIVAVERSLEVTTPKAIGLVMFCGGAYWIIDYLAIVPMLEVPGIWFTVKPPTVVLLLFSIGTLLALSMGVFSKRKKAV